MCCVVLTVTNLHVGLICSIQSVQNDDSLIFSPLKRCLVLLKPAEHVWTAPRSPARSRSITETESCGATTTSSGGRWLCVCSLFVSWHKRVKLITNSSLCLFLFFATSHFLFQSLAFSQPPPPHAFTQDQPAEAYGPRRRRRRGRRRRDEDVSEHRPAGGGPGRFQRRVEWAELRLRVCSGRSDDERNGQQRWVGLKCSAGIKVNNNYIIITCWCVSLSGVFCS